MKKGNREGNANELADCFKKLTNTQLQNLARNRVHLRYNKKEMVAKQGAFVSHIIFIKKGYVKLYIESESDDNKDLIINIFGPNQLIGLSSLFESNIYQYSVSTLVPSEICLFEVKDIKVENGEIKEVVTNRGNIKTNIVVNFLPNFSSFPRR